MIGVLADDLTGAAELGALGWQLGLRADIVLLPQREAEPSSPGPDPAAQDGQPASPCLASRPTPPPDLMCVDSDSRLRDAAGAAARAVAGAAYLRAAGVDWIYKKVDSVLRGQVTAEIEGLLAAQRLRRALLLPANPGLGRTIRDGQYFIGDVPIHQTDFARDPDYPRRSPRVLELLAPPRDQSLCVCRPGEALPETGLVVGEAQSPADVRRWAEQCPPDALAAGGAEFFAALLVRRGLAKGAPADTQGGDKPPGPRGGLSLFVCGSPSRAAQQFVERAAGRGVAIFSLSDEHRPGTGLAPQAAARLAGRLAATLEQRGRAILRIGLPWIGDPAVSRQLTEPLADVAARALRLVGAGRVYAEGGATAVALARRLGWTRFAVRGALAPGVAWLAPVGVPQYRFVVKPGSYAWPKALEADGTDSPGPGCQGGMDNAVGTC